MHETLLLLRRQECSVARSVHHARLCEPALICSRNALTQSATMRAPAFQTGMGQVETGCRSSKPATYCSSMSRSALSRSPERA